MARWTIYDIAKEAGVSAKTVSRVLNGKTGVSEEVRAKIQGIMARVNYHPHIGARSLRGGQRGCIGVTVPAPLEEVPLSQGFFLWLFAELFRLFGAKGEYLCFDVNPFPIVGDSGYGRGLWEQLFKACIVAGPLATDDTTMVRIHESGMPYVAFGRLDSLPECSSATVDYEEGAYLSTKFMLDRGHRKIAMLGAFSRYQPGVERLRGYCRALEEADATPGDDAVRSVEFGTQDTANAVHQLLKDRRITALIDCSATEDATGLREGARRAGRVPGKDFEIIAWTYADNAAVLSEAAAHVWLPVRESAREGLQQLAAWIEGERTGPLNVLYHPILNETVAHGEIERPRRLFDLLT